MGEPWLADVVTDLYAPVTRQKHVINGISRRCLWPRKGGGLRLRSPGVRFALSVAGDNGISLHSFSQKEKIAPSLPWEGQEVQGVFQRAW